MSSLEGDITNEFGGDTSLECQQRIGYQPSAEIGGRLFPPTDRPGAQRRRLRLKIKRVLPSFHTRIKVQYLHNSAILA